MHAGSCHVARPAVGGRGRHGNITVSYCTCYANTVRIVWARPLPVAPSSAIVYTGSCLNGRLCLHQRGRMLTCMSPQDSSRGVRRVSVEPPQGFGGRSRRRLFLSFASPLVVGICQHARTPQQARHVPVNDKQAALLSRSTLSSLHCTYGMCVPSVFFLFCFFSFAATWRLSFMSRTVRRLYPPILPLFPLLYIHFPFHFLCPLY